MNRTFAFWLLPMLLTGCSKRETSTTPPTPPNGGWEQIPPTYFVESPETKEQNQIEAHAGTLFTNGDYVGLESLAAKYRHSKERFADGRWKLVLVYNGLALSAADSDLAWDSRQKQLEEWARTRPQSVMPRVALGRAMTASAWKIRGGDWADAVKKENWIPFYSRLDRASNYLATASRLRERCPVYWSSLQLVALGLQCDRADYDAIFAQAIREFPDYEPCYIARANYLLPRWYGEEGEMEKDSSIIADRLGGEVGDALFARIIWDANHYGGLRNAAEIFQRNPAIWPRVDRGFEAILRQFPDSLAAKTERAYLALLAGDKAKARSYFKQTKGEIDPKHWYDRDELGRFLTSTFSP